MNALTNVAYFLVDTLFTLYIVVVLLRLLLGMVRADFYNPFSQFIVTATNPVIVPLRRIMPPLGKMDTSAIAVVIILKLIQVSLLLLIQGKNPEFASLVLFAIIDLIKLVIYIFMFALIVMAVISWVNPAGQGMHNPVYSILNSLTTPILRPIQQVVPRIGMLDLSVLIAIILLQVVLIILNSI